MGMTTGDFKTRQIIKKTKWNKVPIKNNQQNGQGMECAVTSTECGRIINELNNFQNPTLIPIIMFNNESIDYSIEHVWIVNFSQDSHIGLSLINNAKKRRVEIKGIHTDKESILNQN